MRGSADAVAFARDVASSSPSKPASALDMMRYPRPSSDGLPLPNGIGSGSNGASKKPAAPAMATASATPAPRSSKDDVAPAVATDSSRLAAFLATTSLEPKPRARAPQPPAQAAPTSAPTAAAAVAGTKSPARDHGNGNGNGASSDHSDPASPSSTGAGELLLQWGHNKRMRCRRDSASASPQRRQAGGKIQRRSSSPAVADKLMPPPNPAPYTRGSSLRSASPLHPRSGSGSSSGAGASNAHRGRGALPHPSLRSAEDRAAGKFSAAAVAAARAEKQRAVSPHKVGPGSVMGLGVPVPDPKQPQQQYNQGGSGSGQQQQAGASAASKPAPKLEMPRIYTTLSRKEKEDDFMIFKGTKLPQRPKRRPKNIEKAINAISPGMWLTDVTRSRYEVREKKCPKKQPKNRGLKGMESLDSDSD